MNEGKPTKAKWWSRPRPHGAGTPDTTVADGAGGGDYELDRPAPSQASTAVGAGSGGDFELEAPDSAPIPAHQERAAGAETGDVPSDAVPSGWAPAAGSDEGFGPDAAAPAHQGHVPGAEPGDMASHEVGAVARLEAQGTHAHAPAGPHTGPAASLPADADTTLLTGTDADLAPGTGTGLVPGSDSDLAPGTDAGLAPATHTNLAPAADANLATGPATTPLDRPKPLHAPDPYGTPPYGEPGPWAPAPPVQHPAAGTPAHGTPAHDTPAPVPLPHSTPAHGTPAPSAPVPTPLPSAPQPPPTPAPWQNYDPWAAPGPLQQTGVAVASKAQRRKRAKKALVLGALVLALVSGGVGGAVGAYLERNGGLGDVELPQAGAEAPGRAPDSVAGIAARALPSVVTLHVRGSDAEGTGTGFVLDTRGHILTNNHVVEAAGTGGEISVAFSGGETAKATVVGRDSGYDLAVVRVTGVSGLKPLPLGNSDNVRVGDPVVAIGAPFDLANTVTSGIISAKERPITAGGEGASGSDVSYVDALQTDAPINPGNSGGPLLDSKARVIGINSAIRSADSGSGTDGGQAGSIGLGFAIPVNQAKRVAEELINTGKATHPVIGVTLDMDYTGDGARVGLKGNDGGPAVTADGPGDKAGIKSGDVITEVDGQRVHSGEELIVKTRTHRPGDRLELTLQRDGTEKKLTLVLGSAGGN
ncbi:trypsin-like peptidase domain-containing protein [Streptomyces sp. R21]|uniref:Trypsin-like peptidase domain-containing protein n=1 Tax=Streptomyces sp. R21 TaxID=3238627 RepID=A0AB39P6T0_9ACTN